MASTELRDGLVLIVLASFLSLLLYTLPVQAEEFVTKSERKRAGTRAAALQGKGGVEGVATYCARKYNGRRTYSGERYRPDKLTAAHPSLPLGTRLKVTNLTNRREVVVRINDRCRHRNFPFIDLSEAAAQKLGFLRRGITRVRMVILEEDIT